MLSLAPTHKGAENLRAQLKTRLKKLKYTKVKEEKSGKSSFKGIKKEDMQAVIIGLSNSGKSTLLNLLTNAKPTISSIKFSTIQSTIGMMPYAGTQIQLVEIPALDSEYYDRGVAHTADTAIIIINNLSDLNIILPKLNHVKGKKLILFNPKEKVDERKTKATLKSKKYNFILINLNKTKNLEELKEKIFKTFDVIRVYTKEPGKKKSDKPIVMKPNSNVHNVAEKIFHGFSKQVTESRLTGPSSKFPNQKVGLKHILKDLDIVEFKTR
jgi:ribosome-interacting GTPase 1